MGDLFLEMRKELRHRSTKKHRDATLRFFKEDINPYGVKQSDIRELVKLYTPKAKELGWVHFSPIAEKMLADGWLEEGILGIKLMEKMKKHFDQDTINLFEKWIDNHITNWAQCDAFSSLVGNLIEAKPGLADNVVKWTRSHNKWKRRAAAVSFVIHARNGRFMDYVFLVAESMIRDRDYIVQRGVGWLLKEASRSHEKEVVEFIRKRKNKMARTTLRYAIEKFPDKLRQELMKK